MEPFSSEQVQEKYDLLDNERKERVSELLKKEADRVERNRRDNSNNKLTHSVQGRLVFHYKDSKGEPIPLHHVHVELWDRDIGTPDDYLGEALSDHNGVFKIKYDPDDAGPLDNPDFELLIFEEQHRFDSTNHSVRNKKKLIYTFKGPNNVDQKEYDFGELEVPYWEYDPNTAVARVYVPERGKPPEEYELGHKMALIKMAPLEALHQAHQKLDKIFPISIDGVQGEYNDYKLNKTQRLEEDTPGITRSDAYFGKSLLNGMAASIMDRDYENPELFWIHYHWNSYEQDGIYAMPNVDIKFKLENDMLLPVEIKIGERKKQKKEARAPLTETIVHPDDGQKWEQAKRIARVSSSLSAELDAHLCTTHLNGEQYAIAAYRNIRKNPVRYLLFPHIKEVCMINHDANTFLLGDAGLITRSCGFTEDSIKERMVQVMGTLDWKNWKPRAAISSKHLYARTAQLYWEILNEFVDFFFDEENYLDEIKANWVEIKRFSDDLIAHSPPDFFCNFLKGRGKSKQDMPWLDWNERMDIDVERVNNGKFDVALSPITNVSSDPGDEDIANLKQVCCYAIHHLTFMHAWANSQQYDEGGELKFTSLGLRYGDVGIFTDEEDDSILPPPEDATMQLFISYFLSTSSYGFILKNEERDIHPELVRLLKERKDDFLAIHKDLDVSKLPSRTNI